MQQHQPVRQAFSMVELSVTIVILGLLIGGVIMGKDLLKQSQMQSMLVDYTKYSSAVAQFRQQYGGYPGDLLDATNFWGDNAAMCADADVTDGSPGTCNGDGDEDMSDGAEPYLAWQHLVLAKYISGSFTGAASGGGAVPGTNVPKSQISNTGWSFGNNTGVAGTGDWYSENLGNLLTVGAPVAASALTRGASINPTDAWHLDTKIDNGLPGTGRIVTLKPTGLANCATSSVDATATYKVTDQTNACSLNISLSLK